ncbi:MAG: response regulator [Chloroflexi bacterium]|nr:response regulator [Chloroflexota bacterium]
MSSESSNAPGDTNPRQRVAHAERRTRLVAEIGAAESVEAALESLARGALAIFDDERMRRESERRTAERRFLDMIDGVDVVVWEADAVTLRPTFVNEHAERLLGYPAEWWLTEPECWNKLIHPDDCPRVMDACTTSIATGQDHELEYRMVATGGRVVWVQDRVRLVTDEQGYPRLLRGVLVDVTERRQARDALLEANHGLRAALDEVTERERTIARQAEQLRLLNELACAVGATLDVHSLCMLIVQQVAVVMGAARCAVLQYEAAAGRFRYAALWQRGQVLPAAGEQSFAAASSLSLQVLRTREPLVIQDTRESANELIHQRIRNGVLSMVIVPIHVGDDGWGTLNVGFSKPGQGTPERVALLNAIAAHLTIALRNAQLYSDLRAAHEQLQATQQQIVQQERLRALGEMASGIAHDLNNALAPVVGFAELLLKMPGALEDHAKARQYLDLIFRGAEDAAGVVRRLREFYRQREAKDLLAHVALSQVVEQVIALTQPSWKDQAQAEGRTVMIATDLQPMPPIAGNEPELREALINLVFNAIDAMPEGGTITLRTLRDGAEAIVEVADTGVGMTEDVRRRCLEPFFSTKGPRGTGLGLSMVHGTVQRHRGSIEIESASGRGTTFRIRLPLAQAGTAAGPSGASGEAQASAFGARPRRVLVVDDEPAVAAVTSAYLVADGHNVQVASNGLQALHLFRESLYDLVVTDRAMPEMSGEQLAAALKQLDPDVPVVMLTGFGDLMAAVGERPAHVEAVLGKPVTLAKLRETLATLTPP